MSFRGFSSLSLDNKGRMSIPSRYRQSLQQQCDGQLILTTDPDRCLLVYAEPVWDEVEEKINRLPSTNPRAKALKRLLVGNAASCVMDNNGRILIPPNLRTYASLEKHVALVGQGQKFELWDATRWDELQQEMIELQKTADGQADLDNLSY